MAPAPAVAELAAAKTIRANHAVLDPIFIQFINISTNV
jgi:hypothetical protein